MDYSTEAIDCLSIFLFGKTWVQCSYEPRYMVHGPKDFGNHCFRRSHKNLVDSNLCFPYL